MHWNEFSLHFFEYAHEYNETLIASLNSGLLHQMVLKLALSSSPENPERQEEPDQVVDDLDPAEEGEASEEAHSAPNKAQLGFGCYLYVFS